MWNFLKILNMQKEEIRMSEKSHVISTLVEHKPGVLQNVAGLLNRRGFKVFVVKGDEKVLEQVIKQLHKLVDVVKIKDLDPDYVLKRELCLVKVKTTREKSRSEIIEYADIFKAKIIDVCDDFITMEVTGNPEKIDSFLRLLKPFGIKKIARTGPTAIARGHH